MNAFARSQAQNAFIWALLLTMPWWMNAVGGYTELAIRVVVLGLAAMALNFLLGFTGVLSFGHAAYFGLGAYGAGMTIKYIHPSTPLAIVVGVVTGMVAAMIVGALIIKRRGVYFAMVTIAFGQVFYFIAFRWNEVTGGDDGLTGWKRQPIDLGFTKLDLLGSDTLFYYFVLALFAVSVAIMASLIRSPFGRTLIAIRENERRARFLGIPVDQHIWISFVVSCFFCALAGTLYALLQNFTDPRALRWDQSGNFVIMAVLGGMRSFWGPLIGAAIFVVLQDYVSSHTENWMSIIGVFFILVVLFFPRGVLGVLKEKGDHVSVLSVDNVTKQFGKLVAVNGVSLAVEPGELRAIIGPNGAGKTTFFNLLSGFFPPTSGRILFEGRDVTTMAEHERVRLGMARTFQVTEIFPELTVRENLRVPVEVAAGLRRSPWVPKAQRIATATRIEELMGLGGLDGKGDRLVGELSHGDQRATEIMMSIALKPRLLLLDEPTAGMGDQETYHVTKLIRSLHKDSKLTIMLVEHDMRVVFHLADRIMVLAEGAMLAEGTPAEIGADEHVQAAYLGKAA